jgi:transcription-repair coupling factor (superfamily II helicase)
VKTFTKPLQELKEVADIERLLPDLKGMIQISGCIDAAKPHIIYGINNGSGNRIIVTFQEQKARELCEEYRFFDEKCACYPAKDILFYQSDIRGNVLTAERINALKLMAEGKDYTIVTTFDALMNPMPAPEKFIQAVVRLAVGDRIDLEQFTRHLSELGYEKNYQAESMGEFSVRGGIIDIFPLTEENPFRIELWDDEVDSIRSFDPESQRSIENLDEVHIYPACELVLTEEERRKGVECMQKEAELVSGQLRKEMKTEEAHRVKTTVDQLAEEILEYGVSAGLDAYLSYFCEERVSLLDYLDAGKDLIFLDESLRSIERGIATEKEFSESMKQRLEKGYILPGQMRELFTAKEILAQLNRRKCISLVALDLKNPHMELKERFNIQTKTVDPYNNSFELLIKDLQRYKKNGYRVVLLSGSKTRAKRLSEDLMEEGLNSFYSEDFDHEVKAGEIMVGTGKIKRGCEYPMLGFVVVSESDIFGGEKKKKKRRRTYEGEKIASFTDLNIGDYVVHENHGLGIYRGIEKIEVDKTIKDYIKIEYAGGGNLYILATQLELIQKYAGADAKKPKLNKLGGQDWNKTKTRVRGAVKEIAQDLVNLYAVRENHEGHAYGQDTVWQREFEEMFPFEETEDQEAAIAATKADMESKKIMDRLICGDVGYGKTEIAIRAAFKAVQDGKQVAFLVPTTILAQQHYNNFAQRMKDFPVNVDLLCRFKSTAEQKKTIEKLKKGQVDIVIGTHRLLSKDVQYKDLGLLIIDEEQRFGVTHKEKIKQLKTDIDVLTLTATPIPRTLHMSLIGIRDMSVLEEPPMDRLPIQTYVMEYNEELVREAISRELARGGQAYYVYNRVREIADVAAKIAELVPEASVAYAHGQMKETELENIMYSFINGEIDVLVSTTIIETGLDISNVNTMIIHDADNMGLSQLYQLRGRVGRSNRTAYAFLMYRRDKMLKEVAEKRLAAIKEYTELGSGFKIAMRDLEIRGAGNLLGAEQHGHMEAVGYDLYCKMLNEAVKEAKGIAVAANFDTSIDVDIDAYIPVNYIPNEFQKLDIYKRIAGIETKEESEEMTEELIDRFGDLPKSVENLLYIAKIKSLAHRVYFTEVAQKSDQIRFTLYEKAQIDVTKIPQFVESYGTSLKFTADSKAPYFTYFLNKNSREKNRNPMELLEEFLNASTELLLVEETETADVKKV